MKFMTPPDVFTPFWHRLSNRPTRSVEELGRLVAPASFSIPEETRFSGHWIVAPPGRGKTTLLHSMVMEDLKKDACIILMDSKGDLTEPFRTMKDIQDRLIIIDPSLEHPIGFNPLDVPQTEVNQSIELLEYLF